MDRAQWFTMNPAKMLEVERLRNPTIQQAVEENRPSAEADGEVYFPLLDEKLRAFFQEKEQQHAATTSEPELEQTFPAIDIGANYATHVVKMALRYTSKRFQKQLIWYSAEVDEEMQETHTKAALRYHIKECQHKLQNVLFPGRTRESCVQR
jgi:hypothetical protein